MKLLAKTRLLFAVAVGVLCSCLGPPALASPDAGLVPAEVRVYQYSHDQTAPTAPADVPAAFGTDTGGFAVSDARSWQGRQTDDDLDSPAATVANDKTSCASALGVAGSGVGSTS